VESGSTAFLRPFLSSLLGAGGLTSAFCGVEKLIFRRTGFLGTSFGGSSFSSFCLVLLGTGAGTGSASATAGKDDVFERFEPRVKLKSPSDSSYAANC
jgi:hypothetical protein